MKLIKWLFYIVFLTIILAVAAAAFVVTKVDPNDYKDKIAQQVKAKTGRDLAIDGDLKWSFYPSLGIDVGRLSLSNQAGYQPANMIEAQAAKVKVAFMPLLKRKVEVGKVLLDKPVINLSVNAAGKPNWSDLAKQAGGSSDANPEAQAGAAIGGLIIKGVDITDGTVSWNDQSSNQQLNVQQFDLSTGDIVPGEAVDFRLSSNLSGNMVPSATQLSANGSLKLSESYDLVELSGAKVQSVQDQMDVDLNLGQVKYDLNSAKANAQAVLFSGNYNLIPFKGELDQLNFDVNSGMLNINNQRLESELLGQKTNASIPSLVLSTKDETLSVPAAQVQHGAAQIKVSTEVSQLFSDLKASGAIETNAIEPKKMLADLGIKLDDMPANALQSVQMNGNYEATVDSISFPVLNAAFDRSVVQGSFSIPSFSDLGYRFDLEMDQINFDDYLSESNQEAAEEAGPASIVALPFQALKGLDVKGVLKVGDMQYQGMQTQNLVVDADTTNDTIRISPLRASLYGGETVNDITYDISGKTPKMNLKTELANIYLNDFLKAMKVTERFAGLGNINAEVSSFGLTSAEFISNMNGQIKINMNDGAVAGVDIQKVLLDAVDVANNLAGEQKFSPDVGDKTEFSDFDAVVDVTNGVLSTKGISLQAPAIRLQGRGSADLNTEALDLKLLVSVVKSLEGQGGKPRDELKGEELPLKITGTLSAPKVGVDMGELAKIYLKKEAKKKLGLAADQSLEEEAKKAANAKLREELGLEGEGKVDVQAEAKKAAEDKLREELNIEGEGKVDLKAEAKKAANEKISEELGIETTPTEDGVAPQDPEELLKQKAKEEVERAKKKLLKGLFGG